MSRLAVRPPSGWPGYQRSSTNCAATTPRPSVTAVLQYGAVERLRHAGLLGLRVPARYGGPGASVRDVLERGHSDRPRQFQCGAGTSGPFRLRRTPAEQPGHRGGTGAVVPAASTPGWCSATRSPMPTARRRRARTPRCSPTPTAVLRLNGYKFYSTGTLFADRHRRVRDRRRRAETCRRSCPTDRRGCRALRRLGRLRAAAHRQRRHQVHRGRRATRSRWSRCLTASTSAMEPASCSCTWPRWRRASRTAYSTTRCRTCGRRRAPHRIRWPTPRRVIRSCLQAVGDIAADAAAAEALVLTRGRRDRRRG